MPSTFHTPAIELAVELQRRSRAKFDHAPNDLVRDALFVLTHDGVCVHRAVGAVVEAGWPGPGAALLRTLLDIDISVLAVVNSVEPSMAAFRYFYSGFRRHSRDQSFNPAVRHQMFDQIRSRIRLLPKRLRKSALAVVREKNRPYWYSQEFGSPSDVLERFAELDIAWIYAQLSGTAHGSFMGLRLFRERPDAIDIEPEPPGPKGLSVDFTSCRLLAELLRARNASEQLDLEPQIRDFIQRVSAAALRPRPAA